MFATPAVARWPRNDVAELTFARTLQAAPVVGPGQPLPPHARTLARPSPSRRPGREAAGATEGERPRLLDTAATYDSLRMSTHSVSLDDLDLEETYPNEDPVHGLPEQSTKVLALREAMAEAKTAGKTGPLQTEEGIEVWQEANSKLQIMARMNMGGRKRRASIERRCRLNLGDADLPQLEVAMQQHMDFWMMRNLVLDDSPDRLAEMLFESEQFFRQKRKKTKAGDDTSNLSPPNLFQESGVNTLDPDFGWNIGMHCTALGKVDHMQAALDIHLTLKDYYDIDDGSSSDEEFTETSLDPDIKTDHGGAWEQPFPLDLGHKSYRTLDLRHVYGHAIDGELTSVAATV